MRQVRELSHEALVEIVEALQGHLYLDLSGAEGVTEGDEIIPPGAEYWSPEKSWSVDLLDGLAEKLQQHDLVPGEVEPYEPQIKPPRAAPASSPPAEFSAAVGGKSAGDVLREFIDDVDRPAASATTAGAFRTRLPTRAGATSASPTLPPATSWARSRWCNPEDGEKTWGGVSRR